MERKNVIQYQNFREVQKKLKDYDLNLGEFDVLLELRLTNKWTSFEYLRERTGQSNSDLSNRSIRVLKIKRYVETRKKSDHSGSAMITDKGKNLVKKL